jgi:hypothetical protein
LLKMLNLDLQPLADGAMARGDLLFLLNLRTPSLARAPLAGLWALFGANPQPTPCDDPELEETCGKHLDGSGSFAISPESPDDAFLVGTMADGRYEGGPGTIHIQLPIGDGAPLEFEMVAARARFDVTASAVSDGILGGAITERELHQSVFPAVHRLVTNLVASDCRNEAPPCCDSGTTGGLLMSLLDSDKNCKISLTEFRDNPQVQQMFPLDLDLFDGEGAFAPRQDGKLDSLSFGIGFGATTASFPAPMPE